MLEVIVLVLIGFGAVFFIAGCVSGLVYARSLRSLTGAAVTVLVGMALVAIGYLVAVTAADARDLGQWETSDPDVVAWYRKLMMPDAPTVSCCGEADAYWADTFEEQDGKYVAIITDDRLDAPLHRPHRDIGQRVVIPNHKIKFNEGNPTGHGVLFIGANGGIYCYVPPGGV